MDCMKLADLLFPQVTQTPADLEQQYPKRDLPEGARVTRFAPSPTGFVHFGGLFPVTVCERLAHQSGGVFYLRIEDTDARREISGAAEALIETLAHYGIHFDEGAVRGTDGNIADCGCYGPYQQSRRAAIYHVYAKQLVREGKAYPCFSSEEELEAVKTVNKKAELQTKDWTDAEQARRAQQTLMRTITTEQAEAELAQGHPFVLRILADGDPEKKTPFTDLVRGKLEIPENDEDFVLLKSDGIPTYHFAHAVDDHLMGTTHVVRGEEWLPSLAKHLQLFRYLGFRPPHYLHIAQLMHLDAEGNKKKLSKRDLGANLNDYDRMGYAPACVTEYVMTLLNSNYEEWHAQNPTLPYTSFPFSVKKMSPSGCLFDFKKLNDISRNVLSRMTAEEVYKLALDWALHFDPEFASLLQADKPLALSVLSIGRGGKKPRKDYGVFTELKDYMSFFYDPLFAVTEPIDARFDAADIRTALTAYLVGYDDADDMSTWFEKIKTIAEQIGYASDMKAFRDNPQAFRGNVADISMFIRVAVTGRQNAPDLYTVIHILGRQRTEKRINALLEIL